MPHIHELKDFTVQAFIVHEKKVLLINHKKLKRWLPPGGHVELNENTDQAIYREVLEETGLEKDRLEPMSKRLPAFADGTSFLLTPDFVDEHPINPTHNHIGLNYFFRSSTSRVVLADREHDEIRWFDEEEIVDPQLGLTGTIEYCCLEALRRF